MARQHPSVTAWLSYLTMLAPLEKRGVTAIRKALNKERKKVLAALDQLPASAFSQKRRADRERFYSRIFGLIVEHEAVRREMMDRVAVFISSIDEGLLETRYNENHDDAGRFATKEGGSGKSSKKKDSGGSGGGSGGGSEDGDSSDLAAKIKNAPTLDYEGGGWRKEYAVKGGNALILTDGKVAGGSIYEHHNVIASDVDPNKTLGGMIASGVVRAEIAEGQTEIGLEFRIDNKTARGHASAFLRDNYKGKQDTDIFIDVQFAGTDEDYTRIRNESFTGSSAYLDAQKFILTFDPKKPNSYKRSFGLIAPRFLLGEWQTRYNENHDDAGRFATKEGGGASSKKSDGGDSGGGGGGLSESTKKTDTSHLVDVAKQGGFTWDVNSKRLVIDELAKVVSPYPNLSLGIKTEKLTGDDIARYAMKNWEKLHEPNHFLGAWRDNTTGKTFLDVSITVKSHDEATRLATIHDQNSYYDVGTGTVVVVNEHATSGGQRSFILDGEDDGGEEESTTPFGNSGGAYGRGSRRDVQVADGQGMLEGRLGVNQKDLGRGEEETRLELRVTAADLEREIAKILEEIAKIDSTLNTKIVGEQNTAGPLVQADNQYMKWVANNFNPDVIKQTMMPIVIDGYKIGATASRGMLFKLGVADKETLDVATSRLPKLAKTFIDSRTGELTKAGNRTKEAVRDALFFGWGKGKDHIPGWTEGGNLSDLKDAVRKAFNQEMSFNRARTIARTEVNIAQNTGRFNELRAEGVKKKQWLNAGDEHVRESHVAAANDGPIPMDEPFSNGLMNPGDPDGPPEEVINCRCTLVPVLDDEDLAIIAEAEAALAEELQSSDKSQAEDLELQGPIESPTEAPLDDAIMGVLPELNDSLKPLLFETESEQNLRDVESELLTAGGDFDKLFTQHYDLQQKINDILDDPSRIAFTKMGEQEHTEPSLWQARVEALRGQQNEIENLMKEKKDLLDELRRKQEELQGLVKEEQRQALAKRIGTGRLGSDGFGASYAGSTGGITDNAIRAHQRAEDFIKNVVNSKIIVDGLDVTYYPKGGLRASYNAAGRELNLSDPTMGSGGENVTATIVHELGHALEHQSPHVHERAVEFLLKRAKESGAAVKQIADMTGDRYESHELAIDDKFTDPYAGKLYVKYHYGEADAYPGPVWEWPKDSFESTEVVSMGMQRLYENPRRFAKDDPEYFAFIVGLIQGDL